MSTKPAAPLRARILALTGALIALLGIVPASIAVAAAAPAIVQAVNTWRLTRHAEFLEKGTTRAEEVDLVGIVRLAERRAEVGLPRLSDPVASAAVRWFRLPVDMRRWQDRIAVSTVIWGFAGLLLIGITLVTQRRLQLPEYAQDLERRQRLHVAYLKAFPRAVYVSVGLALVLCLLIASLYYILAPVMLPGAAYTPWLERVALSGVVLCFAMLPWMVTRSVRREIRAELLPEELRCGKCRYPLGSTASICPECGLQDPSRSRPREASTEETTPIHRRKWMRVLALVTIGLFVVNLGSWLTHAKPTNSVLLFLRNPRTTSADFGSASRDPVQWVLRLPVETWTELRWGPRRTVLVRVERYGGEQGEYEDHRYFVVRCLWDASRYVDTLDGNETSWQVLASGGVVTDYTRIWLGPHPVVARRDAAGPDPDGMVCITSEHALYPYRIIRSVEAPTCRTFDVFSRIDWSSFEKPGEFWFIGPLPTNANHLIDWSAGGFPATKPKPW